jgi:hypothetical protein
MRTTVTIDDDVFEAARVLARSSGKRLGQVVSELMRKGLRARSGFSERSGFPTFEVPQDAEVIPGDRARKILDEEGT